MYITMSQQELDRLTIVRDVCNKQMLRKDAVDLLNVSMRQLQRLVTAYRARGAEALAHGSRGKPSHNRLSEAVRLHILTLVNENYADFGPTLAHEKLSELHDSNVSLETLRQWMISDNLWIPHSHRKPRIYQPRHRRDCLGELIQIDGSHHDWFEGRSPKCCLLVFIDDATGRLMNLRFSETESSFDYMVATRTYVKTHGRPTAFYSDRPAVFHISDKQGVESKNDTQYGRALHHLNIELICANTPQAKGRVERANLTLQDRLIKEMRLQNINTIEQANHWLESFTEDFNKRFGKVANYPKNMHREVNESNEELDDIFSWHIVRKLSTSLTFQYNKVIYIIENTEENARLVRECVTVIDYPDGNMAVQYGDRKLNFTMFDKLANVSQGKVVDHKRLGQVIRLAQEKQEELEANQQRIRPSQGPSRKAQHRAVSEMKSINPSLL
jgi:hypothetical protein